MSEEERMDIAEVLVARSPSPTNPDATVDNYKRYRETADMQEWRKQVEDDIFHVAQACRVIATYAGGLTQSDVDSVKRLTCGIISRNLNKDEEEENK